MHHRREAFPQAAREDNVLVSAAETVCERRGQRWVRRKGIFNLLLSGMCPDRRVILRLCLLLAGLDGSYARSSQGRGSSSGLSAVH
jgi:hypothetical protein